MTTTTYTLDFSYEGKRHTFETCGCAVDIRDGVHDAIVSDWDDFDTWDAAESITARLLTQGEPCATECRA